MIDRKFRRLTGSVHSPASSGNSFSIASRNAGLPMYSSIPRQSSGGAGGVAAVVVSGFIGPSVRVFLVVSFQLSVRNQVLSKS